MRAAVLKGGTISIETLPDPTPLTGQILIKPFQTGICGSDLSLHKQMAALEESLPEGERAAATPAIVPGHEFCGEIVELGESVLGTPVCEDPAADGESDACGDESHKTRNKQRFVIVHGCDFFV